MYGIYVLLCYVASYYQSMLPISFMVASKTSGKPHDCPNASEAIQNDMGKLISSIDWQTSSGLFY